MSPKTYSPSAPRHSARRAAGTKPPPQPEIAVGQKSILQQRKAKNKGGRPRAIVESKIRKLEDAFRNDFTLEEAWDEAEVKKSTYYDALKTDQRFSDRMRRAQQYPLTLAKKAVFAQIKGDKDKPGDGSLGLRVLERRQPERYRTKIETDLPPPLPPMTIILPGAAAHPRFTPPAAPAEGPKE